MLRHHEAMGALAEVTATLVKFGLGLTATSSKFLDFRETT